jgi:hypothetical protein
LLVVRRHAGEGAKYLQTEPLGQPGRDRVAHLVRVRVRFRVGVRVRVRVRVRVMVGLC